MVPNVVAGFVFRTHARPTIFSVVTVRVSRERVKSTVPAVRLHVVTHTFEASALFGLGIPPSQFEALKGKETHMSKVLLQRLERLACDFDLQDNYFAWQAFGRRYATGGAGPLPPYLVPDAFDKLRERIDDLEVHRMCVTNGLQPFKKKLLLPIG